MPWIYRTIGLVVVALIAMLTPGWWARLSGGDDVACGVGRLPELVAVDPPPVRIAGTDPGFREILADRHELVPDRRFLLAFVVADCLVTGDAPAQLTGEYASGSWSLEYQGRPVGALRSLPDFAEGLALISAHIRPLDAGSLGESSVAPDNGRLASVRELIASAGPLELVTALAAIDSLWAVAPHAALLGPAAAGLARLALVANDRLEIADPLMARALATLAVAREVEGSDLRREEALLALKMGYSGHAEGVANSLPEDDPVRLFVLEDEEGLARVAAEPGADDFARQLAAYGFEPPPEAATPEETVELRTSPFLPPTFQVAIYLAETILQQHGLDGVQSAAEFERDVAEQTRPFGGPFFGADTYAAYLSSAYYGGLHRDATRHLSCGCTDHGVFERQLEGAPEGTATELRDWFEHLEARSADDLEADLASIRTLGGESLDRSLTGLVEAAFTNPARTKRAAHVVIGKLDSRVDHQYVLARLSANRMLDPVMAERLYVRIVELGGMRVERMRAWLARYQGDVDALSAMIDDQSASWDTRTYAFEIGSEQRLLSDARIRSSARTLMGIDPLDWDVRSIYLEYLEQTGDIDTAIEVVGDWLTTSGQPAGFPTIYARTAMARLHQARGELEDAWSWIEPMVATRQNGAVGRAALIQVRRGRAEEALTLAESAVRWYPRSSWSRAVLAEVLWKSGRTAEAANAMRQALPYLGRDRVLEEFGSAFVAGHEGLSREEAIVALQDLSSAGIPTWVLIELAAGIHNAGRTDLAFELASRYGPTNSTESGLWWMRAYGYLAELEGEARAAEWLRPWTNAQYQDLISMFMFSQGHPDLLWTAIPRPEEGLYPSWVWLMRAAAFVRDGGSDDRRDALLARLATEAPDDPYHNMGRFLMGLADEAEVLRSASDRRRLSEVGYYIALKAQSEGRMVDAVEWYRVVLDTGMEAMGEYRWALETLAGWVSSGGITALMREAGGV